MLKDHIATAVDVVKAAKAKDDAGYQFKGATSAAPR